MKRTGIAILLAGCAAVLSPLAATARPQYKGVFATTYAVKPGSNLDKAGCDLCHMGNNKSVRNPYGADLAKALGKQNASNTEVTAGLKKIEGLVSPDKKTKYLARIKADKLPGSP